MGAAAPSMITMSIAPFEAQKRAQNLGIAESSAVTYAAQHEGASELADPGDCDLDRTNFPAITITCTEGENNYVQTVSRSFRLAVEPPTGSNGSTDSSNDSITFSMNAPSASEYSHFACPDGDKSLPGWPVDPWGQAYYNRDHMGGKNCIPAPAVGGLDPDDDMSTWLWDLRPVFGNVFDRA